MTKSNEQNILVGIDVGSTTTKIVAVDANDRHQLLFSDYARHHANQIASVIRSIKKFCGHIRDKKIRLCLTGSGAKPVASILKVPFVQEVAANAIALQDQFDQVGTAIELGGQDAKMIFFKDSENGQSQSVSDMRMNGSCAGGTGAFIDEIASVLKVPVEQFNELAQKGTHLYDISGRCGVYAKTDIQPLLNQGAAKEDLALSAFHAIAKQTIGGLAQGLEIKKPVAFEGGPLTFHPTLVKVFAERLNLKEDEILCPKHSELMIAYGAALSLDKMFADSKPKDVNKMLVILEDAQKDHSHVSGEIAKPFFESKEEENAFKEAILKVVKLNKRFIPPYESGASLYIRPLLIGTGAQVGVHPANEYLFVVFVTPVGPYFKGGFSTNPYVIIREFDRAAPLGTGIYKVGGNYAASLRANKKAHDLGYACEFYLDAKEKKYIDECGAANFFGIKDNTYITPKSTSILPSITNKSLMQLAEDMGMKVERRPVPEEELLTFEEAGACGTAAVISPIERIDDVENGKSYVIAKDGKPGPVCTKLYNKLRAIQYGDEPDTHGWVTIVE